MKNHTSACENGIIIELIKEEERGRMRCFTQRRYT